MATRAARLGSITAGLLLALGVAGCSGGEDSSNRPSVAALSEVFTSGDEALGGTTLPQDEADCIAERMRASDLADATLQAFADYDDEYQADAEEQELFVSVLMEASQECAEAASE